MIYDGSGSGDGGGGVGGGGGGERAKEHRNDCAAQR